MKKPGTNLSNSFGGKETPKEEGLEKVTELAGRPKSTDQKKTKFKSLDEVKAFAKKKYGI